MENEKCRKAAIVTWCYNNGQTNYGQILQCYAMQTVIGKYGFGTKVIRYRKKETGEREGLENRRFFRIDLYELWHRLTKVEKRMNLRILRFVGFIKRNITLSRQCYTKGQVEQESGDCNLLICGSDQIWNPMWFEDIYGLDFGDMKKGRIAYAPSGVLMESREYEKKYRELGKCLEKFELVTVRERKSKEILSKYTDKEITDVADPTLLLSCEEWNRVASKRLIKEPYIFCYSMGGLRPHKTLIRYIKNKYKAKKIVFIMADHRENKKERGGCFYSFRYAGPGEFLALIRDADAVCTDSFHGLALSMVYRRQFYVMERIQPDACLGANFLRLENLLERSGIGMKRFVGCVRDVEEAGEIDYGKLRIEEYRKESKILLERTLRQYAGEGKGCVKQNFKGIAR